MFFICIERLEKKSKAKSLKTEDVAPGESVRAIDQPDSKVNGNDESLSSAVAAAPEKKVTEAQLREQMIHDEFKLIIKETEDNELEEPFEREAVDALRIAAGKLAYLKKYYNCLTDKFVYFPSVTKLLVNYSLIEEAEQHYFDAEDEFPMDYSAALRTVACEKIGDDDGDDDAYMMLLAADVDLS